MLSQRWRKTLLFCMMIVILLGASLQPVSAQPLTSLQSTLLTRTVLAKAQPDECFHGIGTPYDPDPTCSTSPGTPKVNQAYVWGLTETNGKLWFGTAPNVLCGVLGGYLGITDPIQTPSWVCEFSSDQSPFHSDFRPPNIFAYDLASKSLANITPKDPLILRTSGLRSAGNLNGVILLAGPAAVGGGVNMFAYKATGEYLGSANFQQYSNIRRWIVVNGVLYAGVARTGGGGAVIRWTGDETSPFQVEAVGLVDSDAAELVYHDGRLFVNTWPTLGGTPATSKPATLWMGPRISDGGMTAADAAKPWTKIFSMDQYDPDPMTAVMTGGGAMASFDGYLYWGTMHVPLMSGIYHLKTYFTNPTQQEILQNLMGGHRAISIFRAKNLGSRKPKIELVYGDRMMSAYIPGQGWKILPNKMKAAPLYGPAGFGNFFNNYTWTMTVYNNQLYVGTMDWSYLFSDGLVPYLEKAFGYSEVNLPIQAAEKFYGADLWRFPSTRSPAVVESTNGLGNYSSYGIRNLLPGDGSLYVGMANPMNLMTDPAKPLGGWELIQLTQP